MAAFYGVSDKTDFGDCFLSKLYVKRHIAARGSPKRCSTTS
jgi:hypothetical protein